MSGTLPHQLRIYYSPSSTPLGNIPVVSLLSTTLYLCRAQKKRASKASALDMLSDKNRRKSEIKEKELEFKKMELDFQKQKYAAEAEERKARVQLEFEERKVMLALLQDRL